MDDPNFKRGVILIADFHKEGTVGFILNKPIKMTVEQLIDGFPELGLNVYYGGPVQTDTVHFLHTRGDVINEALKISDKVYWGGDFEQVKSLLAENIVKPEEVRFFIGYSGWMPGQLEIELDTNSWIVNESGIEYTFTDNTPKLWRDLVRKKGGRYTILARISEDYNWN